MFCPKCGAQNEEGTAFCVQCGAAMGDAPSPEGGSGGEGKSNKNKMVGIIAVGLAVLAVVMIAVKLLGGGNAATGATKWMNALILDHDEKAVASLIPKEVINAMIKDGRIGSKDDFLLECKKLANRTQGTWDVYEGMSAKLEAETETDITEEELHKLQADYEILYDMKIEAAKDVTVNMLITVNEHTFKMPANVRMVKTGGSWYADIFYIQDENHIYGLETALVNFDVGAMYARRGY